MSNSDFSIVIRTILSQDVKDIESQIKQLSSKIKERLELKLKIDASNLQVLTKQTDEIVNKLKTKTKMKGSQFINLDVEHQAFNEISSRIREVRKNVDELAKVDINTNKKGQMTSATLTYYNKELGQTITETMGWTEAQKKVNGELVKTKKFETLGFKYSDNMAKARAETEKLDNALNAINRRNFNFGNLITGVNASTFSSGDNFLSYIKKQYGNSAELIGKFNDKQLKTGEIITQANFRVKEGNDKWRMYQATLNKTTGEMRLLDNGLKDVFSRQLQFNEAMKIAITRISQWGIATSLVYGSLRQLKEGLSTLKEIDTELVNIAKVTNYTNDQIKELTKTAIDAGQEYGRTAQEYLGSVTEFARAGMGNQSEEYAKLSLLLQNVGDVTAETANETLLATNAGFQLGGSYEYLMEVIDKFNNISNLNATSVEKLSNAMTVGASVFHAAGMSIDETIAIIGTATASTQRSGSEISRAWRTILMNIRQVADEEAEVTEESMKKAEKALNSVGIIVRDSPSTFRPMFDIITDLGKSWDSLSQVQQAYIAESLAGKRQANVLISTLQNFDMLQKQLNESIDASGSAIQENEIYMQSWEAKAKQLNATVTEFWDNAIDSAFIKSIIDALNGLIKVLDVLINNSFSSALIHITLMSTALYGLTLGFNAVKTSTLGTAIGLVALDVAEKGLIVTTKELSIVLWANPLFKIGLAVSIIYGIIKSIDALKKSNEELQNSYKAEIKLLEEQEQAHNKQSQYYDSQNNSVSELANKREKLIAVLSKQTAGSKEAIATQEALSETEKLLGDIAEEVGLQRNVATDTIIKKLNELKIAELQGVTNTQIAERDKLIAVKDGALKRLAIIQQEINSYDNPMNWGFTTAAGNFLKTINPLNFLNKEPGQLNLDNLKEQQGISQGIVSDTEKQIDALNKKIEDSKKKITEVKIDNIIGSGETSSSFSSSKYISDQYALSISALNTEISQLEGLLSKLNPTSEEYRQKLQQINSLTKQKQTLTEQEAIRLRALRAETAKGTKEYDDYTKSIESLSSAWWDFEKAISDNSFKIVNSQLSVFDETINDLNNQLSRSKTLQSALFEETEEYNNESLKQKNITDNLITSLKQKEQYIQKELASGKLSIAQNKELTTTLKQVKEAQEDLYIGYLSNLKSYADEVKNIYQDMADSAIEAIDDQMDIEDKRHDRIMDGYKDELEAIREIINAKLDLIDEEENEADYQKELSKLLSERQDIQNQINALQMDDSIEAKMQLKELNQELVDKQDKIEEKQHKHTVDLRKKNLQDQLKLYEKDIEEKQDAEDKKYKAEKDRLEDIKDDIKDYLNNILNDERNLLSNVKGDFNNFANFINDNMGRIGTSIKNKFGDKLNDVIEKINDTKEALSQLEIKLEQRVNDSNGPGSSSSYDDNGHYIGNTGSGTGQYVGGGKWEVSDQGDSYYVPGIGYVPKAHEGGIVPSYHSGGEVGGKTSNKTLDLVNKMFNVKPNEMVIKALREELMAPKQNVLNNFMPNLRNLVNSITPNINLAPALTGTTNKNYYLTVNVDNLHTNNKKETNQVFGAMLKGIKKYT